jgi:hypothetical protein
LAGPGVAVAAAVVGRSVPVAVPACVAAPRAEDTAAAGRGDAVEEESVPVEGAAGPDPGAAEGIEDSVNDDGWVPDVPADRPASE